jgi:hypothetical protein
LFLSKCQTNNQDKWGELLIKVATFQAVIIFLPCHPALVQFPFVEFVMLQKLLNFIAPLPTTLKLDSLVCALSGIVLLLDNEPIAKLLTAHAVVLFGLTLPNLLGILGVGLLFVAIAVYAIASIRPINHIAVWGIIFLEVVWIIDSLIVLFWDSSVLTDTGELLITLTALVVLVFMVAEIYGLKNETQERDWYTSKTL